MVQHSQLASYSFFLMVTLAMSPFIERHFTSDATPLGKNDQTRSTNHVAWSEVLAVRVLRYGGISAVRLLLAVENDWHFILAYSTVAIVKTFRHMPLRRRRLQCYNAPNDLRSLGP